jgi:transcriptional regulator with XRE-family HTH domain
MTESFGNTLRRLRLEAGVGLRELARLIDKSAGYMSDVEQDNVPPPSEEIILRISGALQADRNELLKAARKVDPELSRYVAEESRAADFLRMAKQKCFDNDDWTKLSQLAEIAKLGKTDT